MSEICPDKVTSARIFSHGSDSPDLDFIQNHLDSFFPSDDFTKEVIEDNEEASGPVVNAISGEVEDAEKAKEVLDLLLYSDEDLENKVANYNDLDTPQTVGLDTNLIRLIPWTEFALWIDA